MLELHPQFIEKKGKRHYVVLPYEEFLALQERLDDLEDLVALRKARAEDTGEPGISVEDMRKELGIEHVKS